MAPITSVFIALLSLFALLDVHVHASLLPLPSTTRPRSEGCDQVLQRREWRTLSPSEKASYIDAVKCLQALPALKPAIAAARSRFDEFQAYHIFVADQVHYTGQFLPWHRYFIRLFENALRNECGYKGANPYWDWSQDADNGTTLALSPVFDPTTGFGGDGVPGTYTVPDDPEGTSKISPAAFVGCVKDGPFESLTLQLGPGKLITEHCLVRGINDAFQSYLSTSAVANTTKLDTYELFSVELEGESENPTPKLHTSGHIAVGGELSNFYSSPGDPIFYLHHGNLDRIWWNWQQMVPSRLYEIGGSTVDPPYTNITLDFLLDMGDLGPSLPIRDVMDIHSSPSCYTYV